MNDHLPHLMVAPVVLPLLLVVVNLLLGRRRRLQATLNVAATFAGLLVALTIFREVDGDGVAGATQVYLAANWEAPFGIVLVADRLSALFLVLTSVVGLAALVYATAGWGRAGVHFYSLFQLQLMGVNGAFLTGDLFNLFVFFEVMLAASYGLQLHGSGWARVRSGLHYIAVNLVASSLFLIGLAILYGVMGTLSMADVAAKVQHLGESDRTYLHIGVAILAVAFLTKAAAWPLNFWLVPAYSAASAPVAALFALMTKVGVYVLLRLSTLLFSAGAGSSAGFGADLLYWAGVVTVAFGTLGLLSAFRLGRIGAFSILVSSGTLLAAVGFGADSLTSAALYYLLSATVGASALFLLVELLERGSDGERQPMPEPDVEPDEDTNLDDEEEAIVGRVIPVPLAVLGLAFLASALVVAGLPPLSGFVAKLELLTGLLSPGGMGPGSVVEPRAWWLFALLLLSGFATTLALARAGIRHFWSGAKTLPARLKLVEIAPILALLVTCGWLTVRAERVLGLTAMAADALHAPASYIEAVSSTLPVPGPTRPAPVDEGTP